MKLKEFNTENTVTTRNGVASIGVNTKTGLFNLNKQAKELTGLKNGDQIVLLQDEDDPGCWYLQKVKDKGFEIREKGNVTAGLLFNNTALSRALAEGLGKTETAFKVLIAGKATVVEKKTLWGLLAKPS